MINRPLDSAETTSKINTLLGSRTLNATEKEKKRADQKAVYD